MLRHSAFSLGALSRLALAGAALALLFSAAARGEDGMETASGEFDVSVEPLDGREENGVKLQRFELTKTYKGELAGDASGEMLTVVTPVEGSQAYVASEWFEGELKGVSGGFALTHRGVMGGDNPSFVVEIVPDSGTGELAGIVGSLAIEIREGGHFYTLTYRLP